jgi:signal transduction histidine kinase
MIATGVISALMSIITYFIYERERRVSIDEDLKGFANSLILGMEGESAGLTEVFNKLLERMEKPSIKKLSHRFALASADSLAFETSAIDLDSLLSIMEDADDPSSNTNFRTISLNGVDYRIFTKPFKASNGVYYDLIITTSLERLYESLSQLRYLLLLLFPMSVLAAGFVGYLIARRALKPIRVITRTAARITSSNLDARVPLGKTQDELHRLSATINGMIERLDKTFKSQQRFIADVSHDLRTPLTIIQTEMELLAGNPDVKDYVNDSVQKTLYAINDLNRLTDSLLILARADAHILKPTLKMLRLDEILLDSIAQFDNLAKSKGITFIVDINDAVEISLDGDLMKRAFSNIFDNAIKYSPDKSKVRVILNRIENSIEVIIINYGEPISQELLPVIFERFQRGDSSRTTAGFGLGLSISKTLIELHGGKIIIESDAENGTIIKIILPL